MFSEGRILIVDDNGMNRKLTARLLAKLDLAYDEAADGLQALEKVAEEQYALILMDYQMPGIDGMATTRRIRSMEGDYYKRVPIIALTADEREEMQEQFFQAGMNAVLPKPIQKEALESLLNRWLSAETVKETFETEEFTSGYEKEMPEAEKLTPDYVEQWKAMGLDAKEGLKNCGEKELFESLVRDFYCLIDIKTAKLVETLTQGKLKEYTVEVHALKNSARLIGATELSSDFATLENLGNSGSMEEIKKKTPRVLFSMHRYKILLQPYAEAGQENKKEVSMEILLELLQRMKDAVEVFDIDSVDEVMRELENCEVPHACTGKLEKLKAYVADVALEDILLLVEEIIYQLEKAE